MVTLWYCSKQLVDCLVIENNCFIFLTPECHSAANPWERPSTGLCYCWIVPLGFPEHLVKAGSVGRKSSSTLIIGRGALLLEQSEAAGKRGLFRWLGRGGGCVKKDALSSAYTIVRGMNCEEFEALEKQVIKTGKIISLPLRSCSGESSVPQGVLPQGSSCSQSHWTERETCFALVASLCEADYPLDVQCDTMLTWW